MTASTLSLMGPDEPMQRVLDPLERASEIIFGLIMALTFTCTVSVVSSTRADINTMLLAALACNVAWGLVDGAMYVLGEVVSRVRQSKLVQALQEATESEARQLVLASLPDGLEQRLAPQDVDRLAKGIARLPVAQQSIVPTREDMRGAVAIFLLVFLSTLPVAVPFLLFSDVGTALRVSNAVAVSLLFSIGTGLGGYMGWPRPWAIGLAVACFGALLVGITIALGG